MKEGVNFELNPVVDEAERSGREKGHFEAYIALWNGSKLDILNRLQKGRPGIQKVASYLRPFQRRVFVANIPDEGFLAGFQTDRQTPENAAAQQYEGFADQIVTEMGRYHPGRLIKILPDVLRALVLLVDEAPQADQDNQIIIAQFAHGAFLCHFQKISADFDVAGEICPVLLDDDGADAGTGLNEMFQGKSVQNLANGRAAQGKLSPQRFFDQDISTLKLPGTNACAELVTYMIDLFLVRHGRPLSQSSTCLKFSHRTGIQECGNIFQ